jgi:hypothetical protein
VPGSAPSMWNAPEVGPADDGGGRDAEVPRRLAGRDLEVILGGRVHTGQRTLGGSSLSTPGES